MTASIPEAAKVLGIPCPKCRALIAQYCSFKEEAGEQVGQVCAERLAEVVKNDALKATNVFKNHLADMYKENLVTHESIPDATGTTLHFEADIREDIDFA